jgi:hypothetical protein
MRKTLAVFGIAAVCLCPLAVRPALAAPTPISTINGSYTNDDLELEISNTSGNTFTNVQLTLTAYQGLNTGISQSTTLSNIATGTTYDYYWTGSTTPGNLFADDYDDEYGSNSNPANAGCTINDNQYGEVQYYFCADVGNFYVTFTALDNGSPIYSQFSPGEDPLGIGNACGNTAACYVGWEGLDPTGLSETTYDSHNSTGPNGVLANIYAGTAPPVNPSPTPEPSSIMLLGTGLAGLAGVVRRRLSA